MNEPTYKIHGIERRQTKKRLAEMKSYVKNFWYFHQLDKDMTSFYGGTIGYPISDDSAQAKLDEALLNIKELDEILKLKY